MKRMMYYRNARTGKRHNVRNLSWLLKRHYQVAGIRVVVFEGGGAELLAYSKPNATRLWSIFICGFNSTEECEEFVRFPSFANVPIRIHYPYCAKETNCNELLG